MENQPQPKKSQPFSKHERLLQALEHKPLTAKEVSDAHNLPLPTVYRHLTSLQTGGYVQKIRLTFALTDTGRQLLELLKEVERRT